MEEGDCSDVPRYKDVVEMFEDGLDVHIGLLDHRLRHGIPGRHQGHHPVCVHVHTQLDGVPLQGEGEAVAQHLHGPFYLRARTFPFICMNFNKSYLIGL